MTFIRHGFSIGIEAIEDEFFLSLKAVGKLTHEDYQKIVPMIDSAMEGISDPKLKVYIDASELEGWEPQAAWDDFKLGMKYRGEFDKIAIFGNKKWQEYAARLASWFISGEAEYFDSEAEALAWLQE
jgi:hypothetical protein